MPTNTNWYGSLVPLAIFCPPSLSPPPSVRSPLDELLDSLLPLLLELWRCCAWLVGWWRLYDDVPLLFIAAVLLMAAAVATWPPTLPSPPTGSVLLLGLAWPALPLPRCELIETLVVGGSSNEQLNSGSLWPDVSAVGKPNEKAMHQ